MLHLYCVLVPCGGQCSAMFLEVQLVGLLSVIVALSFHTRLYFGTIAETCFL